MLVLYFVLADFSDLQIERVFFNDFENKVLYCPHTHQNLLINNQDLFKYN